VACFSAPRARKAKRIERGDKIPLKRRQLQLQQLVTITQPKVVQTVQQHVSYEFIWIYVRHVTIFS